jgi:chromate transport protein ChrA
MTKNVFAAVRFQVPLLLAGCLWLTAFCILPFVNIWTHGLVLPSAIAILSIAWAYRLMGRVSGISAWNWLLAPFAAAVFVFTMLRSMALTLRQGGVIWRGTFYSLAELRKHAAPLP